MYQHAAGSWALERDTKNEAYQQARSNELTNSLKKMWQKDTKSTEAVANLSCALEDTNHDLAAFAASICPSPQQSRARTQSTTESKQSATSSAGMVDPPESTDSQCICLFWIVGSKRVQWTNGIAWRPSPSLLGLCALKPSEISESCASKMMKADFPPSSSRWENKEDRQHQVPKCYWFSAGKKDSLHELRIKSIEALLLGVAIVTEECTKQVGRSLDADACILTKEEPCGLRLPTFVKGIKYRTVINSRF